MQDESTRDIFLLIVQRFGRQNIQGDERRNRRYKISKEIELTS